MVPRNSGRIYETTTLPPHSPFISTMGGEKSARSADGMNGGKSAVGRAYALAVSCLCRATERGELSSTANATPDQLTR